MTLTHWNPNTTDRVGLEFQVPLSAGGRKTLTGSPIRAWRQTFRSEAAESVSAATPLRSAPKPPSGEDVDDSVYGVYCVEVFADGSEVPSWGAWTAVLPNLIPTQHADWQGYDGASSQALARPEEIDNLDDTAYIYTTGPKDTDAEVNVASGAISASGKRMQFRVHVRLARDGNDSAPYEVGFTTNSGTTICWLGRADNRDHWRERFRTFTFDFPEINPFTGLPWVEADLQAFDTTSLIVLRKLGRKDGQHISWVNFEYRLADENRVAFGFHKHTAAESDVTTAITIQQPAAASNWTKALNTTYSWVMRPMYVGVPFGRHIVVDDGTTEDAWVASAPSVPYLHGPVDPGWTGYDVSICDVDTRGDITDADNDTTIEAGAFARMQFNAFTDGTPYVLLRQDPVSLTKNMRQRIQAPASATYDGLVVIVKYGLLANATTDQSPTADLVVTVRDTGDTTSFGVATITKADVDAGEDLGGGWRRVHAPLASAVPLVSTTLYDIRFTSSTADASPWLLQVLDVTIDGTSTDADAALSTWGGGLSAYIDDVDRDEADVVCWLFSFPAAPGGFAVDRVTLPVSGWDDDDAASYGVLRPPDPIPYAHLRWDNGSVTGFVRYRLQRKDVVDTTWRTIAEITDEADVTFDDYECRIGVQTSYRLQTEVTFGAGAWSSELTHTPRVTEAALMFTTNEDRTYAIAVIDIYGGEADQAYDFAEADEVIVMPIHNRDYPVAFRPSERSGNSFSRKVLVGSTAAPSLPVGPEAYRDLVDMTVDRDLSYICVRDHRGNRWLGAVIAPAVSPSTADDVTLLFADIGVIETTRTPTIATS